MCCTGGTCDSGESHENDVMLYAKIEGRREHIALDTLTYAAYKVNCLKQSRWVGWIDKRDLPKYINHRQLLQ